MSKQKDPMNHRFISSVIFPLLHPFEPFSNKHSGDTLLDLTVFTLVNLSLIGHPFKEKKIMLCNFLYAFYWNLWLERNVRIFSDNNITLILLILLYIGVIILLFYVIIVYRLPCLIDDVFL